MIKKYKLDEDFEFSQNYLMFWDKLEKSNMFLHNIYKSHPCLSPVPSLAIHCANINSVFGISPLVDIKKLWDNSVV